MTDNQGREIFVGSDGQIWTWANGQHLLSRSDKAVQWLRENVATSRDREIMIDAVLSRTSPDRSQFKCEW